MHYPNYLLDMCDMIRSNKDDEDILKAIILQACGNRNGYMDFGPGEKEAARDKMRYQHKKIMIGKAHFKKLTPYSREQLKHDIREKPLYVVRREMGIPESIFRNIVDYLYKEFPNEVPRKKKLKTIYKAA